ncbi:type III pantothenate kinase [Pedobacter metabolipauper]|uniref:Type III pantothenate kinase n=1 Tax=Pedobacter metabolipauper TaxID=425513 RepID=A0A4R6SYU9_9SPHI|nr:type III pantothenate kinase [Pedobacter metabolipauper]TDQ09864.1 type III pantothenate kinase [Pedobacter metabolipauper]
MHNLVIDIGNTNSKLAVFNGRTLVNYQSHKQITPAVLDDLIKEYHIVNSTSSSVGEALDETVEILRTTTNYVPFSTSIGKGIKNNYKTPATLGLDRWAKVIASHFYYPKRNCFIIDAGTCITYDLLRAESEYEGGSISLGIHMRFDALNHFTRRLPHIQWDKSEDGAEVGTDTISAIKSGVLFGIRNEIEGFIAHQNKKNKELVVLITGGDAAFLSEQLKNSIFAPQIIHDPYLVLKGLNEVIAFEYVQKN